MTRVKLHQMLDVEFEGFDIVNDDMNVNIIQVISNDLLYYYGGKIGDYVVVKDVKIFRNHIGLPIITGNYRVIENKYILVLFESLMKNNEIEDMTIIKLGAF